MSVYHQQIVSQIPRLLTLMDRSVGSDTYGCCDPNYWKYNLTDFPCARMQELVLTLMDAYNDMDTCYYQSDKLLEWIEAGLIFWWDSQDKDGSFSEWYPNEHSYVATAMSTYAIARVVEQNPKQFGFMNGALMAAVDFLLKHNETRASNQEAAAIAAISLVSEATGASKLQILAEEKLEAFLKRQHPEGWWPEYGGADIGYLSLTIDFLSKTICANPLSDLSKMQDDAIDKAVQFISYFLLPDYSVYAYGSRNTAYLISSGFELLARKNQLAAGIAEFNRESLMRGMNITWDDRYLAYNGYTLYDAHYSQPSPIPNPVETQPLPYTQKFTKNFRDFWIHSGEISYCIVNHAQGGLVQGASKNGDVKNSYIARLIAIDEKNDKIYTTSSSDDVEAGDAGVSIEGRLTEIPVTTLSPKKNILLRMFQQTFGRIQPIAKLIKDTARNRVITNVKESKYTYCRSIHINTLTNIMQITTSSDLMDMGDANGAYKYVPSSRFYRPIDLLNQGGD